MKSMNSFHLNTLFNRYPSLKSLSGELQLAAETLIECYEHGGKVLICGNGGSCSDSDHIVGELMKGFEHDRPISNDLKNKLMNIDIDRGSFLAGKLQRGLPAISLTAQSALITAVANDTDEDLIFAQQIAGYGKSGDILIAISTSGNSTNVIDACITAKAFEMTVIGFTGKLGGQMKPYCDILIGVPEQRTAFVQELHLPVYHTLCTIVETHFFGNKYL